MAAYSPCPLQRGAAGKWAEAKISPVSLLESGRGQFSSQAHESARVSRLVPGAEANCSSHALENERESRRVLGTVPVFTWSETAPSVGVGGAESRRGVTEV